jgi:hypothetical protein
VYWRAAEKIVEVARQIGLKERPESHAAVGDGIAQLEEPIKGNLRTHRLQLERI